MVQEAINVRVSANPDVDVESSPDELDAYDYGHCGAAAGKNSWYRENS